MKRWHLKRAPGAEEFGPFTAEELRQLADKGGLSREARVRETEGARWLPPSLIPELDGLLGPSSARLDPSAWPFSAEAITLFCICTPMAGGAMWYAWKEKHPAAAAHAARMAWIAFAGWLAMGCCFGFALVGMR